MARNTAAIYVGRLLEIRADAGYRTADDVDRLFDEIAKATEHSAKGVRQVTVVDWRWCPVMSPPAAERIGYRIAQSNSRTERSAALALPNSPVAVLQFVRLIRQAGLQDRKLFFDADELVKWLAEVLTPAETRRLRDFLQSPADSQAGGSSLSRSG
jgi:hypothetical protein